MTRKRSLIAGMTDYTGVPLNDILGHLREWSSETGKAIATLKDQRALVERERLKFEVPKDILRYIDYFIDLLTRDRNDIERVLGDIPAGVREANVEILRQILRSSDHEEDHCLEFKRQHITHRLPDESVRPDLDAIYAETCSMLVDYDDLSNVIPRLSTFIGPAPAPTPEIVQLKPGLWGLNLDIKQAARRLRLWWKTRAFPGEGGG